jgi:hypothetical protein
MLGVLDLGSAEVESPQTVAARIRAGLRGWDSTRGIQTDPLAAALVDAFLGMALTWQARVDGADVPLRDPSAWLEAPMAQEAIPCVGWQGAMTSPRRR